jgi:addiction module HigA family antidote
MEPLELTPYRLSKDLGVAPIAISEILRGRRAISPMMALRLGQYFGVDPQLWLSLQSLHDLQIAAAGMNHRIGSCSALGGRSFLVREVLDASTGTRSWKVLLSTEQNQDQSPLGNDTDGRSSRTKKSGSTRARRKA